MKTTIEIYIPDGYEFVRIGSVTYGENYVGDNDQI